jgi:hypothetical protein
LDGNTVKISGAAGGGSGSPAGSNKEIQFNDNGSFGSTNKFVIQTGVQNRVGIGTNTPIYDLDVTGTIGATNAILASSTITNLTAPNATITSGTVTNLIYTHQTVTNVTGQVIDFDLANLISIQLTGDTTFSTTNRGAGKNVTIRLLGDTLNRNLYFNNSITMIGDIPTGLVANKVALLNFTSFGTAETDTIGAYEKEI